MLTITQKTALNAMAKNNTGALIVAGFGWVFPTHIRNDRNELTVAQVEEMCGKVIATLTK